MPRFILASMIVSVLAGSTLSQQGSIQVGGQTRTYLLHVPSGLPEKPALVLSMHGLGGSGSMQISMSGFDKIADREKIIVAFPDGTYRFAGDS